MELSEIMGKIDNTVLVANVMTSDIERVCNEALACEMATVCIPMSYIEYAKKYTAGKVKVCTVIGFPLGYSTAEAKAFEAKQSCDLGADEVDMVINISKLKNGEYKYVEEEIKLVKQAVSDKVLKVIIETCYLTQEEKIKMCEIVTNAGADFIKTSTGFGTGGATLDDIRLFAKHVGADVKIKAAGGIRSLQDAIDFIEAGASRLGTSAGIKIYNAYKENYTGEIETNY